MTRSLRQSLNVMHTWGGLLCGALIFFVFFTGSLVVFDEEIDRWMMPDTRSAATTSDAGYDGAMAALRAEHDLGGQPAFLYPPSPRRPVYAVLFHDDNGHDLQRFVRPDGTLLPEQGSLGATGFFFPLHFSLHLEHFGLTALGYWIVGLAGMVTLAMVVSGVIVHRRILRDFFSYRPERSRGRALLDLHNVGGVMSLPFVAAMAFSGVAIFAYVYMPTGFLATYADSEAFFHDVLPHYDREAAGEAAQSASLDGIADEAARIWGGAEALALGVFHPGDANGYVAAYKDTPEQISYDYEQLDFDARSGELLHHQKLGPAMQAYQFLTGLHIAVFDSWTLRWLYFLMGLTSCGVIATGFLVWLDKRVARADAWSYRSAQAVAGAATVGLLLATAAMLTANRLLPLEMPARAATEVWVFFGIWLASLGAGFLLPGLTGLRRQLQVLALLCLTLPLLNGLTTGDALPMSLLRGSGAVAGVDLTLLLTGALAWIGARRLSHPAAALLTQPQAARA